MSGRAKVPRKLVSHMWEANFKDIVWNIAKDASGVTDEEELTRLIVEGGAQC